MKRISKGILAALLSVLVVMTLLPVSVFATTGDVSYLDADESPQIYTGDYTEVTASNTTWTAGWYVVTGTVEISGTVTVTGDVHLILKDGCDLKVNGGIKLGDTDSNLTIYAQTADSAQVGKLTATGASSAAGIGSGNNGSCGAITINGGNIEASSAFGGVGIGSGKDGSCGDITINGGSIKATSASSAAGIGSGWYGSCGAITINGGNIEASDGFGGAGIGSGEDGSCGDITIDGGSFGSIKGGLTAAGIGSGNRGSCGNITINDGSFTSVEGGDNGAGIGSGASGSFGDITITGGSFGSIKGGSNAAGIGSSFTQTSNNQCGNITINGGSFTSIKGGSQGAGIGSGNKAGGESSHCGDITISGGSFTSITGGSLAAGIGSGKEGSCGDITIRDGIFENVQGGGSATGIGSGYSGSCGDITISGGTFENVQGGGGAAGIGSGEEGSCGDITISDGSFTSIEGGNFAAGIGSGYKGSCGDITISGGNLSNVQGGSYAAGIGSGEDGSCGMIFVNGAGSLPSNDYTLTKDFTIPAGATLTIEQGKTLTIEQGKTLTIEQGKTLTIPADATLTIESGATLTIESGATLTIESGATLNNNGTISVACNAVDTSISGTISGNVPVKRHSYDNGVCTGCGDHEEPQAGENNCYQIRNADDLYRFAEQVNDGNTGINGKLMNDITVNAQVLDENGNLVSNTHDLRPWVPIGTSDTQYQGTFDGDGKTISGLYGKASDVMGLFGTLGSSGVIQNVTVANSCFIAEASANGGQEISIYAGGICGYNDRGSIVQCNNSGSVRAESTDGGAMAGGICGRNDGRIYQCTNSGSVRAESTDGGALAGGICGRNGGGISGCTNSGSVTATSTATSTDGGALAGGICGYNDRGSIVQCTNSGSVRAESTDGGAMAGGICGQNGGGIGGCINSGSVTATSTGTSAYAGGICGGNVVYIEYCVNSGRVTAKGASAYAGGICGGNVGGIVYCISSGRVTATSTSSNAYVGGICGQNMSGYISNSYYLTVDGLNAVGQNSGTVNGSVESKTAAQFASGEVTWLLNGSSSDNPVFRQTIGSDAYPTLDSTRGVVYSYTDCVGSRLYTNDSTAKNRDHVFGSWISNGSNQHQRTCSACGAVETANHSFGNDNVCDDCGYAYSIFVPITPPVTPTVTPKVVTHFATATGQFDEEAYYCRKARAGDVVLLKVSNTEEGDKLGLDYHKIRVEYKTEGCTMIRDNIDYHGDLIYKDGIAAEFKLAKGMNKVTATVYYDGVLAGTFELFYCYIS